MCFGNARQERVSLEIAAERDPLQSTWLTALYSRGIYTVRSIYLTTDGPRLEARAQVGLCSMGLGRSCLPPSPLEPSPSLQRAHASHRRAGKPHDTNCHSRLPREPVTVAAASTPVVQILCGAAGEEQERVSLLPPARAPSLRRRPTPPASRIACHSCCPREPCSCMTTRPRLQSLWPHRPDSPWPGSSRMLAGVAARRARSCPCPGTCIAWSPARARRELADTVSRHHQLGGYIFGSSPKPPLEEHSMDDSFLQLRQRLSRA